MTSTTSSVRSIRLPNDLWAALQAQADSLGVSLNRYVAMRLEGGVRRDLKAAAVVTAPKATTKPKSPEPALHVSAPFAGDVVRKAVPKGSKR